MQYVVCSEYFAENNLLLQTAATIGSLPRYVNESDMPIHHLTSLKILISSVEIRHSHHAKIYHCKWRLLKLGRMKKGHERDEIQLPR